MPLKIEVGKKYRTRSGDVVEIIKDDKSEALNFHGINSAGTTVYYQGNGIASTFREQTRLDLIEELPAAEPLHSLWAQTMGQRDELGSVRVTCRMCGGAGCADSVTCENGTEVLPF